MTDELTSPGGTHAAQHSLPAWLTAEFPEHLPHSVVSYKDGKYHVSHDGSEFGSVVEACAYVDTCRLEYQLELDDSLNGNGGDLIGGFLLCDIPEGAASGRLLVSSLSEEAEQLLATTFSRWIDFAAEFENRSEDFVFAHHFITNHPVFWTKSTPGKSFDWKTNAGIGHITQTVYRDKDGNQHVMLEAGAHTGDSYMHCMRDRRLVAVSEGYEDALILLASKVHEYFHNDGNKRS